MAKIYIDSAVGNPMRVPRLVLFLFLLTAAVFASSLGTEGGNITNASINGTELAHYWGAIVGTLNNTNVTNFSNPISSQFVTNASIFYNQPNGTYSTLMNNTLILTRLPYFPNSSYISTPTSADFLPGGMFANFTAFNGLVYNTTPENPYDTFAPFPLAICALGNITLPCPIITTNPNKRMGILKFDNGTWVEPIFVELIIDNPGYNGSNFDFQFLVPKNETYYFYTYGLNAAPPNVLIITPQPIVYPNGNLQMTYNITDPTGIGSCWYVLDGVYHTMSSCTLPVSLSVGGGMHNLTLFAMNMLGLTNSDNVMFYVRTTPPPPPTGAGGTHVPYVPPVVPPPGQPPEIRFTLSEEINVTIDYPNRGSSHFYIDSNVPISDLSCSLTGDFANYTAVELSNSIGENSTLTATIYVSMTPQEILDYSGGMEGSLYCEGSYNQTVVYTNTAMVHLLINKPELMMGNQTFEIVAGNEMNASAPIVNVGTGNATAINISAKVLQYPFLVNLISVPSFIGRGGTADILFILKAPSDLPAGVYLVPIIFYDNGRPIGGGTIILKVSAKAGPVVIPPAACVWPDLRWTVVILLIGLVGSILAFVYVFKRKREKGPEDGKYGKESKKE
jgi:hypothetical protein